MDKCNKYTCMYCNNELKIMLTSEDGNETWNSLCALGILYFLFWE